MTSKEALENIIKFLQDFEDNLLIPIPAFTACLREIKVINRDLEVLKLLKKLPFEIYQNGGGDDWNWFIDTKQSFKISKEEAIKLKEWLKNE